MIERHFIQQEIKKVQLEKWLKSELERAGFTRVETIKTPLVTRIVINVTHPGLAIGKGGTNIRRLTEEIEKKFQIDNPQIEINEIQKPELDAQAMADKIKTLLERGYSWRSVGYKVAKDIMNAGAQGVEIVFAGALAGKGQRKRRVRIFDGYMKKVGDETKLVDAAKQHSYPKFGAIGVKVKIVRPETVFTDKINIKEILGKRKEAEEEAKKPKEEKKEEKKTEEKKVEAKAEAKKEEKKEVKEKIAEKKIEKKKVEEKKKIEAKKTVKVEEKKKIEKTEKPKSEEKKTEKKEEAKK